MKKSSKIQLGVVSAFSAMLMAGCSSTPTYTRHCVDAQGRAIPDQQCSRGGAGRFIYMGSGGRFVNGVASGYSNSMPADGAIKSSSGTTIRSAPTSRSGFGGRSSSFGG